MTHLEDAAKRIGVVPPGRRDTKEKGQALSRQGA